MKQEQLQSIGKAWLISKRGFSLVEAILAVSIFGMLVSILVGALLYGQDSTRLVGNREEATFLAEEALDAVHNIRDADFSSLSNGTYGLDASSGEWELSGSSDINGEYTRTVTISSTDSNRKLVLAEVSWEEGGRGAQKVSLSTYLTNWQKAVPVEDCDSTCTTAGYASGICREDVATCSANGETSLLAGDTYCTVSGINTCCCVGGADLTAPSAISDLSVFNVASSSISLTWTASGDDGNTGTATSYDIRYSTALINETNWSSATQLVGEPTPSIASSTESITVAGLSSDITYYFALKVSDEVPNESILSNVVATTTLPGPDLVAPVAISDLTLSNETVLSIDLTWTAPGDDGSTGTATSYDIRYSTALIDETNWSSATQISGEPTPSVAGTSETVTVFGLLENTTYYFAIKTTDDEGHISDISNVPNASTLLLVNSCDTYCRSVSYVGGTCRASANECMANDEVWETAGDTYCSSQCCCGPIEDVTAPSAITDAVSVPYGNYIHLNFTAPGDNGDYGNVSNYEVRYSTTAPLTEATWSTGIKSAFVVHPFVAAGESEVLGVVPLVYNTFMYVYVKAIDEAGNYGGISNETTVTTAASGKVICTEAYRQGYLAKDLYQADGEYARKYASEAVMRGYHSWGKPVVRIIQHNLKLAKRIFPFTREWSKHSAYALGRRKEDSPIGKMLIETAFPLCEELGEMMAEDGQYDYQFDDYKVEVIMKEYFQDYFNMGLSNEELVPIVKKDLKIFMAMMKEIYLEDRANGFTEEKQVYDGEKQVYDGEKQVYDGEKQVYDEKKQVYDEAWFVKLFNFIRNSYEEIVDKISHE